MRTNEVRLNDGWLLDFELQFKITNALSSLPPVFVRHVQVHEDYIEHLVHFHVLFDSFYCLLAVCCNLVTNSDVIALSFDRLLNHRVVFHDQHHLLMLWVSQNWVGRPWQLPSLAVLPNAVITWQAVVVQVDRWITHVPIHGFTGLMFILWSVLVRI